MNLIEQNVQNITQTDFSYEGIMKFIERVGRICTNSNHRITEDSWIDFDERLRRNGHWSVFGHATAYFKIPMDNKKAVYTIQYLSNSYHSRIMYYGSKNYNYLLCVSSVRCLEETKHSDSISTETPTWNILEKYLVDPNKDELFKEWFPKRQSLLCSTSIAVSRELNRHGWNLDIMEKSTRYTECFDIIKPYWYDTQKWYTKFLYRMTCKFAFINYKILLKLGLKKQDARGVLPLDTATQVIYTAFNSQWQDVIAKRTTSGVHPDCRKLVEMARDELK
jgi:thymidylate synthase ThyX